MSTSFDRQDSLKTAEIDESLYSRQLYVLGKEAMHHLANAHVLISGMRGLGVEIAKNIILGGAKSVVINDTKNVEYADLSSQYYFSESDVGINRAQVAHRKLSELNSYVIVSWTADQVTDEYLAKHKMNVVVLTDSSLDEQIRINEKCHEKGIKFVNADTKGLFGQIFCDFGDNFQVVDTNGENPLMQAVTEISHDEFGVVFTAVEARHGFEDGSYVTFQGAKGMPEVNEKEFKITVTGPFTFTIGDTRSFGVYQGGATVIEVKKPEIVNFKPLSKALKEPEMLMCDFSKMSMPSNLHLAFQALYEFEKQHKSFPKPWDNNDAEQLYAIVEKLNVAEPEKPLTDELNKLWIKLFAKTCRGDVCPLQAVIGGIAAQEVMKAVTGKFMPIRQYFYFDAIECLPESALQAESDFAVKLPTKNSRYYSQELIFGEDFQEKICKSKYFVVGSGAIGCEMLKNFVMMGIGCDKDGGIYVTDMDSIEKSNLNRQFLFRSHDIGQMKSKVASKAVQAMNPNVNITAYVEGVLPETEHIYNDTFFERLDGVVNALDNVKARQYIDRRCVFYKKPLVDSGTLGTKASVQVVVPHLTESYSSTQDPVDPSIPMCLLHNFPNLIEHTIQWARDNFAGLFTIPAQQAEEYIRDQMDFISRTAKNPSEYDRNETVENMHRLLINDRPADFNDCIKWARKLFQQQFHNAIAQLLFNFPADQLTTNGERFWSGNKRCPHVLNFNPDNSMHLDFIIAASNLLAFMYDIKQNRQRDYIKSEVSKVHVEPFQPKSGVVIHENDEQMKADLEQQRNGAVAKTNDEKANDLKSRLPSWESVRSIKIRAHEFEKDDDSNFHMDYIAATANLRADNYEIQSAERSKIKRIAGNIIPAIATTTAMVTGLVCLEVYKFIQNQKKIESFKNAFVNLALPLFAISEPVAPARKKYLDQEYTLWDRFDVNGDLTLEELLNYFKTEHKLKVTMLASGLCVLYAPHLLRNVNVDVEMKRKITDIYEMRAKTKIASHVKSLVLDIICEDLEGNDIDDVPFLRYILK